MFCVCLWKTPILSMCTCCQVSFPLDVFCVRIRLAMLLQPNPQHYVHTFQIHLPACQKWTGVWYLVSLERTTLEPTKQCSFYTVTKAIFWPWATQTTGPRQQCKRSTTKYTSCLPDFLSYSSAPPVLSVSTDPLCVTISGSLCIGFTALPARWIFWQCGRTPKMDSAGNACSWCLCCKTNAVVN